MAKAKRGNSEGSISLRPDGRWVARITVGWENGKPKRKAFYGKTRQEVASKLAAGIRTRDQGLTLHNEKQTLGDFLNQWLADVIEPKVRPSTYRSYEQIVRNHLIPGLGKLPLSKLTPQDVTKFLRAKHDAGISAEHLRRVLRASLSYAVRFDLAPRNVASLASCPTKEKADIKYLDPDQARRFLKAIQGHRHEALYTVALAVGLRLGEALGLKWSDLDLQNGSLTVSRQLQRVKGKLVYVETKTRNARRSIPLPAFAVQSLQNLWARQQMQDKELAGDDWQENGLVFTSSIGTPADPRNVRRSLTKVLADNKLPELRFHDLRHSCATLLLSQGTDPRTIMQTLGHSQITLTLNTYSHVIPALQRDAADKMDSILQCDIYNR
ncbi:MAG: tyrosine-type recombinase/integrase [Armatimonadetes bacterium]|nr:tyrosine-type recombinase/integrase [Armatimonadota bacterium]